MTIELQNGIVQTNSQEKIVDLYVLPGPLKNEAGRYSNPSVLSPTSAQSVILASRGGGDQSPPISTSVSESPTDISSNSAADSSDLSHEKLPRIYFDNVVSLESSQPIDNSYSEQLPRIDPDNVIPFESNQAIDGNHNEQLPLSHADSALLLMSHEEIDVGRKVQDPSQQPNDIDQGTIHPPENEKSVKSGNESSRHEPSPSKSDSDKELTVEGLPQVPSATGVTDAEEIRLEQELISSNSQDTVSVLNRKATPSENCSNDSPYKLNNQFRCEKPINNLQEAEEVEQLEPRSPKSLHTSPDELLKVRKESVSRSSRRGTKLFTDKPVKQSSEANRSQPDRASEQFSRATQNGIVEKKSAKKSPDKPPRSSPSKPPKPMAAGSTDKDQPVQKCTVTEVVSQKQPCSSPDKRAKGSVEKVAKQRQSPVRNKQIGSNGSGLIDGKMGGSPNSARMFDKDVRPRSGSPSVSPFLFKLAKSSKLPSDNPFKALDYALQSVKFFERSLDESHSLELVMSLHVLAAVYCRLGQYEEAVAVLERSLALSETSSQLEYALASFSGYMQLGDTFSLLGRHETSVEAYHAALKVQKQAIGELDPRVGDTCRYLTEAHLQAMQFNEAEMVCQHLLKIHSECSSPGSVEEAADRRLMALICSGKADHEKALEYLVLASMALISDGQDLEAAFVQSSIGDTYVDLERFEDAVFAYQKALTVFKSVKGGDHASVASVYVSLADLYMKTGRQREAKIYCESALRIYRKHDAGHFTDEVASGLTEIASIYEALNEPEQALQLLQNALELVQCSPGQQSAIAGIKAQMGVLHYLQGKPTDAFLAFKDAVILLKSATKQRTSFLGILLNQMGLACVELYEIVDAAELFEEAKSILEETCGPDHPDTLTVCGNLAGAYDALGRLDDAIQLSKNVLKVKEEYFGAEHPEVKDGIVKLKELQKEVSFPRLWKRNRVVR